jgi:hypothetical protein
LPVAVKNVQLVEEDKFEDIKLNDDGRPKKRNLFYRFGVDHSSDAAASGGGGRNGLFGRKDVPHEIIVENELRRIDNAKKEDK